MTLQHSLVLSWLLIGWIVSFAGIVHLAWERTLPGRWVLRLLFFCSLSVLSCAFACEMGIGVLFEHPFMGIVFTAGHVSVFALLWLSLSFSGILSHWQWYHFFLAFVISIVLICAAWTNPWHHLVSIGGDRQLWTIFNSFYGFFLYLCSLLFFGRTLWLSQAFYRPIVLRIFLAVCCPMFVYSFITMETAGFLEDDLVWQSSLPWLTLFLYVGLRQYHGRDLQPLARDMWMGQMRDGVLVLDRRLCVVEANKVAKQLLALPDDRMLVGRSIHDFPLSQTRMFPPEVDTTCVEGAFELCWTKENQPCFFEVTWLPLFRNAERLETERSGFLVTWHEITNLKLMQTELLVKQGALQRANTELEQFAFVAAHDLQEPLRKLSTFNDRLRSRSSTHLDDKSRLYLERMDAATGRMRELINDILAFSRVSRASLPMHAVDLNEIVEEVLQELSERVVALHAEVVVDSLPVLGCAESFQIRQLFQNLLSNALKFRRPTIRPMIEVGALPLDDGGFEVWVQDNGIGFSETYKHRIFEMFKRLHTREQYEGTGIGLAICARVMERHQGEIRAEGKVGEGARFVMSFPVSVIQGTLCTQEMLPDGATS